MTPYIEQGIGVSEALSANLPVYNFWKTQNVGGRGLNEQFIALTHEIKKRIDAL